MGLNVTAIYIQPCQFHDRMKFPKPNSNPLVWKPKSETSNLLIALDTELNQ